MQPLKTRRGEAAIKRTEASDEQSSLSPQRGEGRGEGWERRESWRRTAAIGRSTPHPHSLSPLRGEGGPASRTRKSLRALRKPSQIVLRKTPTVARPIWDQRVFFLHARLSCRCSSTRT